MTNKHLWPNGNPSSTVLWLSDDLSCFLCAYTAVIYYGGYKQKQGEYLRMNSHHLPVLILVLLRGNGHLFFLWIFFILPLGSS